MQIQHAHSASVALHVMDLPALFIRPFLGSGCCHDASCCVNGLGRTCFERNGRAAERLSRGATRQA